MQFKYLVSIVVLTIPAIAPSLSTGDELYWYYQYAGVQQSSAGFPTAVAMGDGKAWPVVFAATAPTTIQPVTLGPFRNTATNTYWHPLGQPTSLGLPVVTTSLLTARDSINGDVGLFFDPSLPSTSDTTSSFIGNRQTGLRSTATNVLGLVELQSGTLEAVPKEAFQTLPTTLPVRSVATTPWGALGVLAGTNLSYFENTTLWGWQSSNISSLPTNFHAELAYDGAGRPVFAYSGNGSVSAGTFDTRSGTWQTVSIGSGNISTSQSLYPTVAADSKGGVGVAWVSTNSSASTGSTLMYAYKPLGEDWKTHVVTSSVSVPTSIGGQLVTDPVAVQARVGLAFDAEDLPVISFTGSSRRVYIAYDPLFPTGAVKDESRLVPAGETILDDSFVTGPIRFVKEGAGTLIRGGAATNSYGTLVAEGTLTILNPTSVATGPFAILGGAKVVIDSANSPFLPSLSLQRLSIDSAGQLDLGHGRIEIVASGITEVDLRTAIAEGRDGGGWGGTNGIVSSAVAGAKLGTRAIGYTVAEDKTTTVAFAAPGDTNLDGLVNVFDLVNVSTAGRYGSNSAAAWSDGDFNYDGASNVFDLLAVTAAGAFGGGNYLPVIESGTRLGWDTVAVPEPCLGALAAGAITSSLLARHRYRRAG